MPAINSFSFCIGMWGWRVGIHLTPLSAGSPQSRANQYIYRLHRVLKLSWSVQAEFLTKERDLPIRSKNRGNSHQRHVLLSSRWTERQRSLSTWGKRVTQKTEIANQQQENLLHRKHNSQHQFLEIPYLYSQRYWRNDEPIKKDLKDMKELLRD